MSSYTPTPQDMGQRVIDNVRREYPFEQETLDLIASGADLAVADDDGMTALMHCAVQGHFNIMQAMFDRGISPDQRGPRERTALMTAASKGKTDAARFLLAQGADPRLQDNDGNNALIIAAACGHPEIVVALVQKGADYKSHDRFGVTPLRAAEMMENVNPGCPTIIRYLRDLDLTPVLLRGLPAAEKVAAIPRSRVLRRPGL